jgi:phosphatidylserine/phosphatidylglycerophosphate/cardiolipin synthase-like enzyme
MRGGAALFLSVFIVISPAFAQEFQADHVTTCVSPDSSLAALTRFLDGVSSTLYVNVYTLTSSQVATSIGEVEARGAHVIVLVEKSPVGGISQEEKVALNMLLEKGVEVFLSDDPAWRFNHGKYAIADGRWVFISTENLGYGGFPEEGISGNRGWCAVIQDEGLAEYLTGIFFQDLKNAVEAREPFTTEAPPEVSPAPAYSPDFPLGSYDGKFMVVPAVAPEGALEEILDLIASARESVYVEQFYAYTYWGRGREGSPETTPNLFLDALIDAARRGCEVKLLLDGTWYNVERDDPRSNYHTVNYLNRIAQEEDLDLQAKILDSQATGLEKLHAKGVVVDGKAVLISSVNWNEHSPTKNREVGVIIYGEPAEYYAGVFEKDWYGHTRKERTLILALGVVFVPISLVYLVRRRNEAH